MTSDLRQVCFAQRGIGRDKNQYRCLFYTAHLKRLLTIYIISNYQPAHEIGPWLCLPCSRTNIDCFCSCPISPFQTICRGSFIGHGDYISHVISEMTRLTVTSSNSLRKSSPSARQRARSMGRLGDLVEGDTYQYEELGQEKRHNGGNNYWQVQSESGSPKLALRKTSTLQPNGVLPRAKSTHEMSTAAGDKPAPLPKGPVPTPPRGGGTGHYTRSEWAGHINRPGQQMGMPQKGKVANQRPASCYNLQTLQTQQQVNMRVKPGVSHLPDLLTSSKDTSPQRPHSSCDLKVSLFRFHLALIC